MTSIDYASPALGPVRAAIAAQIDHLTKLVVSPRTPLESVPGHRGEILALNWLLDQLQPPRELET